MGIKDERKGKPLIVPRTGTRAWVPKVFCTSNGALNAATSLDSMPSSLTLNVSLAIASSSIADQCTAKAEESEALQNEEQLGCARLLANGLHLDAPRPRASVGQNSRWLVLDGVGDG